VVPAIDVIRIAWIGRCDRRGYGDILAISLHRNKPYFVTHAARSSQLDWLSWRCAASSNLASRALAAPVGADPYAMREARQQFHLACRIALQSFRSGLASMSVGD